MMMGNETSWSGVDLENVTSGPPGLLCDLPSHRHWRGQETPSWDTVRHHLRWFFLLHAYGFASSFFILAFYAFFSILNIRSLITSRPFMSTINVFLCLLGASRAGSLFIDPYNLKETMPAYFGSVMWDIGFPSIISAFSLVQLAFLHLTQLKLGPEKLRNKSCLSLIITAHFTCVIGFDIVLAIYHNFYLVRLVLETSFLVWGVLLCCTFLYAGYRVMTLLKNMSGILLQRDLGTTQYKGIMQLAMLAPYNNLATSVAAALVPTLLAPNMHLSGPGRDTLSAPTAQDDPATRQKPPLSPRSLSKPSTSSMDETTNATRSSYSRLESSPGTSRQNSVLKTSKSQSSESGTDAAPEVSRLKKNLSWRADDGVAAEVLNRTKISFKRKKPKEEENENQITAETTLLPQQDAGESGVPDLTLHTILNHIAYVNRAAAHSDSGLAPTPAHPTPASRKKQVTTVLRVTYATAILGLTLCLANIFQLYGPYGVSVSRDIRPWPWFCFQTLCRAVELAMGCAMANITKQPVTHRHQYLQHHYSHSIRVKQRESLFM